MRHGATFLGARPSVLISISRTSVSTQSSSSKQNAAWWCFKSSQSALDCCWFSKGDFGMSPPRVACRSSTDWTFSTLNNSSGHGRVCWGISTKDAAIALSIIVSSCSCVEHPDKCDWIWENQPLLTPQIFMAKIMYCTAQVNLIVITE